MHFPLSLEEEFENVPNGHGRNIKNPVLLSVFLVNPIPNKADCNNSSSTTIVSSWSTMIASSSDSRGLLIIE